MDSEIQITPTEPSDSDSEAGSSPFTPSNLVSLFLRPAHFFGSGLDLDDRLYIVMVAWICGIAGVQDRIDNRLAQADLGGTDRIWGILDTGILDSWPTFWLVLILLGSIGGLSLWLIGGWWYKVRLGWAGAYHPDPHSARLVYIYSSLVLAGPAVLVTLMQTFLYSSYREVWETGSLLSLVLLVFVFRSCWVSYQGARTVFPIERGRGLFWFLILPVAFYVVVLGVVGVIFAMAE